MDGGAGTEDAGSSDPSLHSCAIINGVVCDGLTFGCPDPRTFCASNLGECFATWSEVPFNRYCGTLIREGTYQTALYNVEITWNADVGWAWYYDRRTGDLVAVLSSGLSGGVNTRCVGGPASFTVPTSPMVSIAWNNCTDAGAAAAP